MFKSFNFSRSLVGIFILIAMLCGGLLTPSADAVTHQLLWEDWERPVGTLFPWSTYGHMWGIYPNPPSLSNPRWDIERNSIYHSNGSDTDITSVWCVGSNDQLLAGQDFYLNNVYTHLYWGPFSIADATINEFGEAYGSFWIWADMEANGAGQGDFYALGVRSGGFTPAIGSWDMLYRNDQGGTGSQWVQVSVNFDEVVTAGGDTISYIDQGIVNNLYISLIFDSDFDQNDFFGVFIDDVALGYEDGLYDFDYSDYELFDPDDPEEEYDYLSVNTPAQMRVKFKSHGPFLSNEVDHVLYNEQNQILSTVTGQWLGGSVAVRYEEPFPLVFTPQQEGELTFTIYLDANSEQDEAEELNNFETFTVPVYAENTAPTIEWINPPPGGVWFDDEVFEIIFNASNSPVQETATLSLYYDYDQEGFDGYNIDGGTNLTVQNGLDTLEWYIGALPALDYYLYAKLSDGSFDPVYMYADAIFNGVGVEEASDPSTIPDEFQITSVYPNPFNPTVDVVMDLPSPGDVQASWYSVDGRLVDSQKLGKLNAGSQRFAWTPHNLPSGVYLLRLDTPFGMATEKVTYLK
jgi:hypothetical protein